MIPRLVVAGNVSVPDGVEFDDRGSVWTLRATRDLGPDDVRDRSPRYDDPSVTVSISTSVALADLAMLGFAATQFALPVRAEPGGAFDFRPAHNLRAPAVVLPLLLFAPDGTVELLAPLGAWHEQIIAVRQGSTIDELVWGWHGDLVDVPSGFTADLGIFTGTSVAEVLRRWGAQITTTASTRRTPRRHDHHADPLLTHLSYWTDNGAAYWYRTEPGLDLATTLERKADELRELGVGIGSFELDSWFYPHEISRPVSEIGYLDEVPPTGMLTWTPRPDVLPDGVAALRERLGDPTLVLHSRHISLASPYLDDGDWWTEYAAHPVDPTFFRRWFRDAAAWGATCVEQDWMMMTFFGVRELRSTPGRAMDWQRGLDDAAGESSMSLLWCMALPGDIAATVELSNVVAIRTSDDYRFAADPALLWVWYLTVNALCDALDIAVFKDCFFTASLGDEPSLDDDRTLDVIDGDPYPEIEALLSALSGGVVGIGDRLGRTDVGIVARMCRPDGLLLGPDRPITLTDASFRRAGTDGSSLCWASTHSGDWIYVVALHTAMPTSTAVRPTDAAETPSDTTNEIIDRHDLDAEMLVYDWRTGSANVSTSIQVRLGHRDWALFVCCPIQTDPTGERWALIGDPSRYATMSRRRVDLPENPQRPVLLVAALEEEMAQHPAQGPTLRWWSDRDGVHDRPVSTRRTV